MLAILSYSSSKTKTCTRCKSELADSRENFYSAGLYKGKQYRKSRCISCEKEEARARYEAGKEADTPIYQALTLAKIKVKLAFNLYLAARDMHKKGIVDRAYRLQKLSEYVEAEQALRLIQKALPRKRKSMLIFLGEYENLTEL